MTAGPGGGFAEVARRHAAPRLGVTAALLTALLAIGIGWAAVAEIEEVVSAPGEVVPVAQVQIVQHLEGGLLRALEVEEGALVERGEPLLELALPVMARDRDELAARHAGLVLTAARLEAELADAPLALPAVAADYPTLAAAERATYASRRAERAARRLELDAQVRERELAVAERLARRDALTRERALAAQTFAVTADLVRDNLVSRLEHLRAERDVESVAGELATVEKAIVRSEAALTVAREHRATALAAERRATVERLRETRLELARTEELLRDASEQRDRAVVRSPLAGIVKNIRHHTIGAVVRPGEPLLEIVPAAGGLRVEARLAAADRGQVRLGQGARLKVSAYDFLRHGTVEATVTGISADTLLDGDGRPYYELTLAPARASLGADGALPLLPGMESHAELVAERRTVLAALVRPLRLMGAEALRERD